MPDAAREPRVVAGPTVPTRAANAPRPFAAARDGASVLLASMDGAVVAFIADEDDSVIRVVDVDDERELAVIRPGAVPAQMTMTSDGALFVSLRDASKVAVFRRAPTGAFALDRQFSVATEPMGLALSPDEAKLVVASRWGNRVGVYDARTSQRLAEHAVAREPQAVVVSSDGKRAFVSHVVGKNVDVVDVNAESGSKTRSISIDGTEDSSNGGDADGGRTSSLKRQACQGFTLVRAEEGRVFAPHVLAFTGDPNETSSGYGAGGDSLDAEVFNVPVIDEEKGRVLETSTRVVPNLRNAAGVGSRCTLPRAAAVGKAGIFVTCLGENSVALFDSHTANPHDVELRRWNVPSGPVGIALDEGHQRAVVWSQFAHALTTIAIGSESDDIRPFALSSVTLPRATRASAKLERGRELFHATRDASISGDGRACASCHPDGRDDSLVWSSPNGPRQTPVLAGRLDGAAPFGWNGDAVDISTHLASTVKRLGGKGLTGDDKDALIAYVKAIRPPPPLAHSDREALERGKAIFVSEEAGCASCHGAGGDLPDGAKHDVKSRAQGDARAAFDTPSLRFVGRSGPYFHDGRFNDLKTLLRASDGKMGHTKHLTGPELADLAAYVESL